MGHHKPLRALSTSSPATKTPNEWPSIKKDHQSSILILESLQVPWKPADLCSSGLFLDIFGLVCYFVRWVSLFQWASWYFLSIGYFVQNTEPGNHPKTQGTSWISLTSILFGKETSRLFLGKEHPDFEVLRGKLRFFGGQNLKISKVI